MGKGWVVGFLCNRENVTEVAAAFIQWALLPSNHFFCVGLPINLLNAAPCGNIALWPVIHLCMYNIIIFSHRVYVVFFLKYCYQITPSNGTAIVWGAWVSWWATGVIWTGTVNSPSMPASLPADHPPFLPAFIHLRLPACLYSSIPACIPSWLPACLPACQPASIPVCMSASLSAYLFRYSIRRPACVFVTIWARAHHIRHTVALWNCYDKWLILLMTND